MTKKNTAATVATIIVAVLAIAAVLFLFYSMSKDQIKEQETPFIPTEEVNEEMNVNAERLVKNNCAIFRLYLEYGVSHEAEPYNNKPEDGLYTVVSSEYTEVSQIEKLVNETFVEKEAKRIITNINGDNVTIFRERKVDGKTVIGLDSSMIDKNGRYKTIDYNYSWNTAKVSLEPISNTECKLTITLKAKDGGTASGESDSKSIAVSMIKANGVWLLQKLAY